MPMKKSDPKSSQPKVKVGAKAAVRSTSSRPSRPPSARGADPLVDQAVAVQALVSGMPSNTNKAKEIGHGNAVSPPRGLTVEPSSPAATASTLSESNASAKTGDGTP